MILENGQLTDRYRIGTDTGCIVSNHIGYCCMGRYYEHHCRFINCWRVTLHTMIKGRSSVPSHARRARRACCFIVHDMGEGWRGGRRKETVSRRGWYQVTKTAQYWSWHHHAALPPPTGSNNNSQLSITLTFLLCHKTDWACKFVCC